MKIESWKSIYMKLIKFQDSYKIRSRFLLTFYTSAYQDSAKMSSWSQELIPLFDELEARLVNKASIEAQFRIFEGFHLVGLHIFTISRQCNDKNNSNRIPYSNPLKNFKVLGRWHSSVGSSIVTDAKMYRVRSWVRTWSKTLVRLRQVNWLPTSLDLTAGKARTKAGKA